MTIQIAPSILSADFCNLERDLKAISNADLVHVDVMDHHFVPNLTLGEPIVARICEVTDLPVDVHLMIDDRAEAYNHTFFIFCNHIMLLFEKLTPM